MKPIVSICMITYNHEKYIDQAIESILTQKTNFDFEIVIGEDCSTDSTRKIVLKYKDKHPDQIKLLLKEKNVGMGKNFIDTLKACKGKYIAMLEGDDYWTDEYKLQKQVDFLEVNPEFVAAAHQTIKLFQDNEETTNFIISLKKVITDKSIKEHCPFHLNSILFKNDVLRIMELDKFPVSLYRDYPIIYTIASQGKINIDPTIMSVYRRHDSGISGTINSKQIVQKNLAMLNDLANYVGIPGFKKYYLISYWKAYLLVNTNIPSFKIRIIYFFHFFISSFYIFPYNIKSIIRAFIRLFK